ncbi:hypothetical protein BS47DRAFT_1387834 [Hydnum rufescens UP504]|uniref:C3H1-type domain-containing protein n=1 Tax=Hydnum rufescens UP504 TaxID=1448309 RepID=A0A9P6B9D7_9AGAM|nr:hypothetical protein BS47DRAFT_1387834 [Hydnum rufescens UP504]
MTQDDTPPAPSQVVKSPHPCWRFLQGIYCPEELCHYQHGPPLVDRPTRRSPSNYGPSACLYFAQGYCRYGARCQFAHIPASVPATIITQSALTPSFVIASTSSSFSPVPILPVRNIHSAPETPAPPPYPAEPETSVDEDDIIQPHPLDEFPDEVEQLSQPTPTTILPALNLPLDAGLENKNEGSVEVATDLLDSSLYVIDEEVAALWEEVENAEDEGMQYVDRTRSRQVYDDKKVLVLSGGVMLGPPRSGSVSSASSASASQIPSRLQGSFHTHEWSVSSQPSSSTSSDFTFASGSLCELQTNRVDESESDDSLFSPSDTPPHRAPLRDESFPPQPIVPVSPWNILVPSETALLSPCQNKSFQCSRKQERPSESKGRRGALAGDNVLGSPSSGPASSSNTATTTRSTNSRRHTLSFPVENSNIDAWELSGLITPQPRRRVPSF